MELEQSWTLDVLDLLFDESSGLLKDDINSSNMIHPCFAEQNNNSNFNIDDLDLLSDNLFENFIHTAEHDSFIENEPPDKRKVFHSDHDYIAHKSPSEHSDSGISIVSEESSSVLRLSLDSDSSKKDDQIELFTLQGYTSVCPDQTNSINHFLYTDNEAYDVVSEHDTSLIKAATTENNTPDKLSDFFDDSVYTGYDDDISIDLDLDSSDTSQLPSEHLSRGTQSVLILNGSNKVFSTKQSSKKEMTLPFTVQDVDHHVTNCGNIAELRLSDEEKELLAKEGVNLPTNLPLTRDEERMLKAVRRKIRNKISAKESRKRKQGYVEGLEKRIKHCTQENRDLHKKVENLEKQNVSLITQLKRLHSIVGKSKVPVQASTCAMVLLLSFALFIVPTFNPFGSSNDNHTPLSTNTAVRGKARSLLELDQNSAYIGGSDDDPYGISSRPGLPWEQQATTKAEYKLMDKALPDKMTIERAENTTSNNMNNKTEEKTRLNLLSRDMLIELAHTNKDYSVNNKQNLTDQNF